MLQVLPHVPQLNRSLKVSLQNPLQHSPLQQSADAVQGAPSQDTQTPFRHSCPETQQSLPTQKPPSSPQQIPSTAVRLQHWPGASETAPSGKQATQVPS
jgi:hypothetical protein